MSLLSVLRRFRVAVAAGALALVAGFTATAVALGGSGALPWTIAGAALTVGIAAFAGLRWTLAPLRAYAAWVERLATGDLDEPGPQPSTLEFESLALALERTRLSLRQFMSHVARQALEFEGSLRVLDLPSVMRLIRSGKRSGALVLQKGGDTAIVYWKDGEVCGAVTRGLAGYEALMEPFRWEQGSFKFSPTLAPRANLSARWEEILLDGARRVDSSRVWSRSIPSPRTQMRRSSVANHVPLRQLLTPDEARVLDALGRGRSAIEVSELLEWPVHKVWYHLYCLSAIGVVESRDVPGTPSSPTASLDSLLDLDPSRPRVVSATPSGTGAGTRQQAQHGTVVPIDAARRRAAR